MPAADDNVTASPDLVNPPPVAAPEGHPAGPRALDKQYEFKPSENQIIGELAGKMHFVGLFMIATGLLVIAIGAFGINLRQGIPATLDSLSPIFTGTLTCVVGLWTQRASVSFKNVVYTEGRDISHLIAALEDLRKLYSLQFWLLILGLILAAITLLVLSLAMVDLA
jgi:hypothetical protein